MIILNFTQFKIIVLILSITLFFLSQNSFADGQSLEKVNANIKIKVQNFKSNDSIKSYNLYLAVIPEGQTLFDNYALSEESSKDPKFDWNSYIKKLPYFFQIQNISSEIAKTIKVPPESFKITALFKKSDSCEVLNGKAISSCFPEKEDILCNQYSVNLSYLEQRQVTVHCLLPNS